MIPLGPPSEDELCKAVADAVSDPAIVDLFLAALEADENDEAVYGWMAEEIVEPAVGNGLPADAARAMSA